MAALNANDVTVRTIPLDQVAPAYPPRLHGLQLH
jgi:hypothetical protein